MFAPFIDIYYFKSIGKCKTWILGSSTAIIIFLFFVSHIGDKFINPSNMNSLIMVWFTVNSMIVFLQIAGEMWIVKIFSEEEKAKGSVVFDIGLSIGGFLFYNIFVPLNSVDWLNQNFFKSNPRTVPLVSHRMAILTIMGVVFVNSLVVLVFIAEKKSHVRETKPTLGSLIKLVPKFFTHTNMRNYMIFLFLNRCFSAMINESLTLKLLDNGI